MEFKLIWSTISTSKEHAIFSYQVYKGNVKFYPSLYLHLSEHETMFSWALAKFQDLVIFEG